MEDDEVEQEDDDDTKVKRPTFRRRASTVQMLGAPAATGAGGVFARQKPKTDNSSDNYAIPDLDDVESGGAGWDGGYDIEKLLKDLETRTIGDIQVS